VLPAGASPGPTVLPGTTRPGSGWWRWTARTGKEREREAGAWKPQRPSSWRPAWGRRQAALPAAKGPAGRWAAAFAAEQLAMSPLPAEPFDPARLLQARVDNRARVCVRQNYYSVPARYAGRRLPVRLSARSVEVLDGPQVVASHERAVGKYAEILTLDHYLEVLKYKPGALPGATALAQARTAGAFTAVHQRYWDATRRAHGDAAGTRALIEVLLAHRTLPATALTTAMAKAVSSGVLDPQIVLIDARRAAGGQVAPVIPIGALARYDRPAPTLTGYDELLTRSAP
jgi:hypothetical protein